MHFFDCRENVWSYFAKTSLANLRIALSMSPAGEILRAHCRSYPGLVNSTTIDWMFSWPEQALLAVANVVLRDVSLRSNETTLSIKNGIFLHAEKIIKKITTSL